LIKVLTKIGATYADFIEHLTKILAVAIKQCKIITLQKKMLE